LLRSLVIKNINGSAPESVRQALAHINAAFSNVSKYGLISIFVRKVKIEHTSPTTAKVFTKNQAQ
jgi:hypothetical protein